MQRFRGRWLAMMGGILLLTLSVSTAFGADPAQGENRGQTISAFVHELLFGANEPEEELEDESELEGEEAIETEESDTHGACVSEVAQSDAVGGRNENHGGAVSEAARVTCREDAEGEEEEPIEEEPLDEEASSHGACVSEVARDKNAIGGKNDNHGGAVSEAARETCWETDEGVEAGEPSGAVVDETLSAKEQRKADRAAARAERKADRGKSP
ncbi:MAG: hypothetical protein ACRDGD_00660 [Candidatus Limnocylindria bacterium]